MNSYVERTRPALSFVDIGIALRDYPDAALLSTKSWELHTNSQWWCFPRSLEPILESFLRIVSSMFYVVNSRCAHRMRPPVPGFQA